MTDNKQIQLEDNALLLDVRTAELYAQGHIEGSKSIPLEDLAAADLPEDKDQPIYVHCRLGIKSQEAKALLEEKGYTKVVDLGSIDNLTAQGFDYIEDK